MSCHSFCPLKPFSSNQGWQVFASQWKKTVFSMVKTGLAKIVFAGKKIGF